MVRPRILLARRQAAGGAVLSAEIVAVGTELLLGQIANTNAQTISVELAAIGVDVYFHSVVGDNLGRMTDAISRARERSDVVIVTGGLGPTPDDVTRDAVAAATDRRLRRDERLAREIAAIFARLRRDMPPENLRQADLPVGAVPIEPEGTAPGFYLDEGDRVIFALPGVPWEMEAMLTKTVLPLLRRRAGDATIASREVLVIGLGESATHRRIADIVEAQDNPTIAYLAGGGQVRVRITAKASSAADAQRLIEPVETEIRGRLGDDAVGGDHRSLGDAVGQMLRDRGATLAVAESLTGGLIGAHVTRSPGATDFFVGGLVCYSTESKAKVAGVDEAILSGPGPVSAEAAGALAEAAAARFGADLGVSATGVAGPTKHDGKPAGSVYVGAAFAGVTEVRVVRAYGDRENVRTLAVTAALDLGRRLMLRR